VARAASSRAFQFTEGLMVLRVPGGVLRLGMHLDSFHEVPTFFDAPFSAGQVETLLAGRVPAGRL